MPIFLIIWSVGPSDLIGLWIFLLEKNYIINGPIKKTITIDVNMESPVLTVRYLKTLKKEYVSVKYENKLYSIHFSLFNI